MKRMLDLLYAGKTRDAWFDYMDDAKYLKYLSPNEYPLHSSTPSELTTMLLLIAVAEGVEI